MTLIRHSYFNTGLKGAPINQNKSKIALSFTAERSETGEQHVAYGLALCQPGDKFTRKEGRELATSRLATALTEPTDFSGGIVLPKEVNLDQIPNKIIEHFEAERFAKVKTNPYLKMSYHELDAAFNDIIQTDVDVAMKEYRAKLDIIKNEFDEKYQQISKKAADANPELASALDMKSMKLYDEPHFNF